MDEALWNPKGKKGASWITKKLTIKVCLQDLGEQAHGLLGPQLECQQNLRSKKAPDKN